MPLLVSLKRDVTKIELGTFERLVLTGEELRQEDGKLLARHRHNRWMKSDDHDPFVNLEIIGPLVIRGAPDPDAKLGPYRHFSTFDGVAYVEQRVFGFWDVQHHDWYVVDAGAHWKALTIAFHSSD